MATVKVKIRIRDAEFEAEGSRDDVDSMLAIWWAKIVDPNRKEPEINESTGTQLAKPKRSKNGRSRPVSIPGEPVVIAAKFDTNKLANKIKENAKAAVLTEKIWHQADRYNKIALVCMLAGEPLTSGDICKVLSALQIKITLSGVSAALSKNSTKFLNSAPRKAGGAIARYSLTLAAEAALKKLIDATS